MGNLLKADIYKLKKSTALKVSFLISFMSVAVLALMLYHIAHGNIGKDVLGSLSILTDAMMVSLLSSLVIGIIICGDFKSKNIHSEITSGGRVRIVMTKTMASMFMTAIMIFPYAIFAVLGFISNVDLAPLEGIPSIFINIMTNVSDVAVSGSTIGKGILLCLIGIFTYMARLSICIPVAFIVRSPVAVIAAGVISSFGFDMIVKAVEDVPVLGYLFAHSPYAVIYDLAMDASIHVMIKATISSIIFISLMALLTYLFFRRSEIK